MTTSTETRPRGGAGLGADAFPSERRRGRPPGAMDERNGAEDAIGRRDERGAIDELLCFALLCFARRSTELTDAASGCDSTTVPTPFKPRISVN